MHGELNCVYLDLFSHDLDTQQGLLGGKMSRNTTIQVGIKAITLIELLHSIGYTHGDLKPDNFLIDRDNTNEIKLIDFGLAENYTKDPYLFREPENEEEHIEPGYRLQYGNPGFCSKASAMNQKLCRRDDIESLLYILINMETGKYVCQFNRRGNISTEVFITSFLEEKVRMNPIEMLRKVNCLHYREFAKEVFSTGFSEKPDYKKLKFLLLKCLLD